MGPLEAPSLVNSATCSISTSDGVGIMSGARVLTFSKVALSKLRLNKHFSSDHLFYLVVENTTVYKWFFGGFLNHLFLFEKVSYMGSDTFVTVLFWLLGEAGPVTEQNDGTT